MQPSSGAITGHGPVPHRRDTVVVHGSPPRAGAAPAGIPLPIAVVQRPGMTTPTPEDSQHDDADGDESSRTQSNDLAPVPVAAAHPHVVIAVAPAAAPLAAAHAVAVPAQHDGSIDCGPESTCRQFAGFTARTAVVAGLSAATAVFFVACGSQFRDDPTYGTAAWMGAGIGTVAKLAFNAFNAAYETC